LRRAFRRSQSNGRGYSYGITETRAVEELTPEDLEKQQTEGLPNREAISMINAGIDGLASVVPAPPGDAP
jgi:hypothetical protein